MDSAKQQLVEKIKASNNVLVAVSRNPSVDQLAALLGLSLLLNKQGKHCAAVFSGTIPSTLEFLKPEDTFEKNTDSLRDFIIALDKSKADKLRYKVEDNVVRIFITPYKTSISQEDLEFSQGDFNVDLVVGLGVHEQADLDQAIITHGRILHDATVASITINDGGELGSINWHDPSASSLSELVTDLSQSLGDNMLDQQIATALLTGIVSETNRFSNDKTSSRTMSSSAILMAAGANQQLVATKLEEPERPNSNSSDDSSKDQSMSDEDKKDDVPKTDNGTLEIEHDPNEKPAEDSKPDQHDDEAKEQDQGNAPTENGFELPEPVDHLDDAPKLDVLDDANTPGLAKTSSMITEPPSLGGTLTANAQQNQLDPVTDPMSLPATDAPKLLERTDMYNAAPPSNPTPPIPPSLDPSLQQPPAFTPPPAPAPDPPSNTSPWSNLSAPTTPPADDLAPPPLATPVPSEPPVLDTTPPPPAASKRDDDLSQLHIDDNGTLTQLEEAVNSPHLNHSQGDEGALDADDARAEVDKALNSVPVTTPPPIEALNAQPMGPELHNEAVPTPTPTIPVPNPDLGVPAPPPVPPPFNP
jgi:hypothetical protein